MSRVTISPCSSGLNYNELANRHETPLLLLNPQTVLQQYRQLKKALPNVDFFYAIKSLPHSAMVEVLNNEGCGFDLATTGEIESVQPLSIPPRRTIHTHPIKRDKDIRAALRFGCTTFVVDNAWELEKLKPYFNRVGLLLRISYRNPTAIVDLSKKFGCDIEEATDLLKKAKAQGLHIKGLSFHVGSQCEDGTHHAMAIEACNQVIRDYNAGTDFPMSMLDVGGGFPVTYLEREDSLDLNDIERFCLPIREALAHLPSHVQVMAEPGRYLSAPAMKSVSRVMGKARRQDAMWYYLDDGMYGSFSGQLYDHMLYPLEIFSDSPVREKAVFAGPTCDSIDVIAEDLMIPHLEIGDIVVGHQMGAYTAASATDFNMFDRAQIIVDSSIN